EESRARLTKVAEFYDPARHHHHTLMFGRDPGAIALAHLALGSVCTGELDRALAEMHTALELVTRWPHPFSEAWVRVCAAEIHLFRDEVDDARREAEAAIALAR